MSIRHFLVALDSLQLVSVLLYHEDEMATAAKADTAAAAMTVAEPKGALAALQPSPLQQKTQLKESAEVSQSSSIC